MEKMYRFIVLIGLLIGLIINAVATYNLRQDITDLGNLLEQTSSEIAAAELRMKISTEDMADKTKTQLAEHERLISQLENMMNFQLDN